MISIKCYLFCFFFLFITPVSFSQVNAIATYTFEWASVDYKKDYRLIINNQLSNYQYHNEPSEFTSPQGYLINFPKNYFDWYYDAAQKKIVEQRVLKEGTKVIANWSADLTWDITEETKEIAGYKVQKAIAQVHYLRDKEREDWDYGDAIAWFTTDIPISSGPQRFYGLPGLIVYLEFTKSSHSYTLKNIEWDTHETIIIPTDGIEVTKEQTLNSSRLLTKKWLKKKQLNK